MGSVGAALGAEQGLVDSRQNSKGFDVRGIRVDRTNSAASVDVTALIEIPRLKDTNGMKTCYRCGSRRQMEATSLAER